MQAARKARQTPKLQRGPEDTGGEARMRSQPAGSRRSDQEPRRHIERVALLNVPGEVLHFLTEIGAFT